MTDSQTLGAQARDAVLKQLQDHTATAYSVEALARDTYGNIEQKTQTRVYVALKALMAAGQVVRRKGENATRTYFYELAQPAPHISVQEASA